MTETIKRIISKVNLIPFDMNEAKAEIIAAETLHRLTTANNAKAFLEKFPDGSEARENARKDILEQADHYQRMASSLTEIAE